MSTNNKHFVITNPQNGIDNSALSHVVGLADPASWRYIRNFRMEDGQFVFVPGETTRVRYNNIGYVPLAIIPIIQPGAVDYNVVILTERAATFLTDETGEANATLLPINGTPGFNFNYESFDSPDIFYQFKRWSYTIYGGYIFFTNLLNKVLMFRYNSISAVYEIRTLDDSDPTVDDVETMGVVDQLMPKAKYICALEGHLICAHTREDHYWDGNSTEPLPEEKTFTNRVRWSQRDVIGQALYDWFPGTGFNADFKDLSSTLQFSEYGNEITGMNLLRNAVALYTRTGIYEMSYVGLPTIMKFRQVINVGCHFPYSVAVGIDIHYFIGIDGIYSFNGSSVQNIGTKIWPLFKKLLSSNREVAEKCYAWTRLSQHQIWWFFISDDSYAEWCFDNVMIYDYVNNTWTMQTVRAPFCVTELNTTLESDQSRFRALLYGAGHGSFLTEIEPSNEIYDLDGYNQGILISQDFQFEDPEAVKELTSVYLDAEVENVVLNTGTYVGEVFWGIAIYVSVREYTSDPLKFVHMGVWKRYNDSDPDNGLPGHVPLEIKTAGRILNFAFVPVVTELVTDEESDVDIAVIFEKTYANV